MPTGRIDYKNAPNYISVISESGYTPVLGMSAPLKLAEKEPGNVTLIRESLHQFAETRKQYGW